MNFPITVKSISVDDDNETLHEKLLFGGKCGDMVSVRPCGEEYEGKTFFGILLGEMALSVDATFNDETGDLQICSNGHNPAIFVPDLNKVIYGCESWWGRIENEDDLKEITDADIGNVWYVTALQQARDGEKDGEKD